MKILIIRLSSIGDIVLTTPVVRGLRQAFPDATLHYLTRTPYAPLLTGLGLDCVLTEDDAPGELLPRLKAERYDYVADLHCNRRSAQLRRALGVPAHGFPKEDLRRVAYVATKRCPGDIRPVLERYFDAVRPLGVRHDGRGAELHLDPSRLTEQWATGDAKPDVSESVVLVCGAAHYTKQIPAERLLDLCHRLPMPTVLIGGPRERDAWQLLSPLLPQRTTNLCGRLTLEQSAQLVSEAAVVVTPDTGMMHIAAAFRRPVVAVWGCTTPRMGFAAYDTCVANFEVSLACRPCSRFGNRRCPRRHFDCIKRQDWQAIASKTEELYLNNKHTPHD